MSQGEPEWLEAKRRASGLWLDEEGVWRFGTGLVENERVCQMFDQGLEIRDDGELILHVGTMWCYIQARKAIYFVSRVREEGAELRDGRVLPWTEARVGWGPDDRLYLQWPSLRGPALCLRTPHQQLLERVSETATGLVLSIGDQHLPVLLLDEPPRPQTALPHS